MRAAAAKPLEIRRPFPVPFIMLKKIREAPAQKIGGQFAIIAARYNSEYTDALVRFAQAELKSADETKIVRVPGAFEIPAIAARLARSGAYEAIICFGAI